MRMARTLVVGLGLLLVKQAITLRYLWRWMDSAGECHQCE